MKKTDTSPVTQRATVELEGGFCGSVMQNHPNAVEVKGHTVGEDYDFAGGTSGSADGSEFNIIWE